MHVTDTCNRYKMHSKRYGLQGPDMGSYVLDNTSNALGICLGVQHFIPLGVHVVLPKRYRQCIPTGIPTHPIDIACVTQEI